MTIPAPVAYFFVPLGLAIILIGVWPFKGDEKERQIWRWSFPDNLYLVFIGLGLAASGLDFALFGILPVWGK